ncbi:MAG TPA: Nudix family hydrolase [Nitrospinaceae bacterium]|jgi:8-oxo-dGTP diphosphatase|nr:Nudix family hydrolase [Nitrospinaceae bacterium]
MLHVAVGVIKNKQGDVLISRRASGVHQGGLWEFPGGKVEEGESTYQALKRELTEELGITISSSRPLLDIYHDYGDLKVHLDVHQVDSFHGIPQSIESQPVKWIAIPELKRYAFPVANKKIIDNLNLSDYYPIVDDSLGGAEQMLIHLSGLLAQRYSMIQLRAKSLDKESFAKLAKAAMELCNKKGVTLFLNTSIDAALALNAKAVHLSVDEFHSAQFPLPENLLVSTSCHSEQDLRQAQEACVLFAVLSPVAKTKSHPEATPLGWELFSKISEKFKLPVFALGGVGPMDIEHAKLMRAYGVAGIRAFINETG